MQEHNINTCFDIMKEFLIQGAYLDGKYQIPMLPATDIIPVKTVDFGESFNRSVKEKDKTTVNFYIDDTIFLRLWNSPTRYIRHLKEFHSVISPDFTISTGEKGMPFALNLFNHYRNHALGWYLCTEGINVIPSVSIADKESYDWIFDGVPMYSTLSVCTNGRVRSKVARLEFCEGFYEMCQRLEPIRVVIIGRIPEELNSPVEIINLKSRNQQINDKFNRK